MPIRQHKVRDLSDDPARLEPIGICGRCRRYNDDLTCTAFPYGIPRPILTGEWDHRDPYPGDGGQLFQPMPPGTTNGPVRFVLFRGLRDDDTWGALGGLWRAENDGAVGFLPSPKAEATGALWRQTVRQALKAGATADDTYLYWKARPPTIAYSVDPERTAESLATLGDILQKLR